MRDLIDRQAAIDAVNSIDNLDAKARGGICIKLMGLPSAQPSFLRSQENDPISRRATIDAFKPYAEYDSNRTNAEWVRRIETVLRDMPSVQPGEDIRAMCGECDAWNQYKNYPQPEIIHCRDCKYYIPYEWMFDGIPRSSDIADYAPDEIGCSINDHNYQPDGFCSYAERREEGRE